MAETRITGIIESSLEQIRNVVDANTIIGDPISTPNGTTVIPVSKVMVGFASGGVDYLGKNMKRMAENQRPSALTTNFGGGGGTGVTVQPVGFLIVSPDGNVQLLNVGPGSAGSGDKIDQIAGFIEKTPDLIAKFKAIFAKNKAEDAKSEDNSDNTADTQLDEE